jgi:hypothetical protein
LRACPASSSPKPLRHRLQVSSAHSIFQDAKALLAELEGRMSLNYTSRQFRQRSVIRQRLASTPTQGAGCQLETAEELAAEQRLSCLRLGMNGPPGFESQVQQSFT